MIIFPNLLWISLNVLTAVMYSETVTDILFPGPPCQVRTMMPGNPSPFTSVIEGSCNSMLSCAAFNGVPIGKCPATDVCCAYERTCDQSTSRNHTYFVNPAYPSPFNGTNNCPLTVYKASPRICQLRLDFVDFDIHRPTNGSCENDRFIVTGQSSNSFIPPICGLNTGHHMYVDVERNDGPFIIRMTTSGEGYRRWNIKITQIECNNPSRAPPNCLQYFIGPRGTISSFNYDVSRFAAANTASPTDVSYLNGLDYAMCFRKEEGFCSQTYTANTSAPFQVVNLNADGSELTPTNQANAGIVRCPNDYLLLSGIRFCGSFLNLAGLRTTSRVNAPVTDSTRGPFIARFISDAYGVGRGFQITYQQNPCGIMLPAATFPTTAAG